MGVLDELSKLESEVKPADEGFSVLRELGGDSVYVEGASPDEDRLKFVPETRKTEFRTREEDSSKIPQISSPKRDLTPLSEAKLKPEEVVIPAHYETADGSWILPEDLENFSKNKKKDEYTEKLKRLSPEDLKKEDLRAWVEAKYPEYYQRGMGSLGSYVNNLWGGWGIKGIAKALELKGRGTYEENFDKLRALQDKYNEEHLGRSLGAGLAGGAASLVGISAATPARVAKALDATRLPGISKFTTAGAEARLASRIAAAEAAGDTALATRLVNLAKYQRVPLGEAIATSAVKGVQAGVPYGAVYAAGETSPRSTWGEMGENVAKGAVSGGVLGGGLGVAAPMAGRTLGWGWNALKGAVSSNNTVWENVGRNLLKTHVTPDDIIDDLLPDIGNKSYVNTKTGAALSREELFNALVDSLDKKATGKTYAQVAADHNIDKNSLESLARQFRRKYAVPGNLLSSATTSSRMQSGAVNVTEAEEPLLRHARATSKYPTEYGEIGELSPHAKMKTMLEDQQNRMASHLDVLHPTKTRDEIKALRETMKDSEKAAYEAAFQNEKPFSIRDVIVKWRGIARDNLSSNDEYFNAIHKALDQFFHSKPIRQGAIGGVEADLSRPLTKIADVVEKMRPISVKMASLKDNTPIKNALRNFHDEIRAKILSSTSDTDVGISKILDKYYKIARDDFRGNKTAQKQLTDTLDDFHHTRTVDPSVVNPVGRTDIRPDYNNIVKDLRSFKNARDMLTGMIRDHTTFDGGRRNVDFIGTKLIELKNDLNAVIEKTNKPLRNADRMWHEGKIQDEIRDVASGLRLGLGKSTQEALDFFKGLSNEGKKIFKDEFVRSLKDALSEKNAGSGWLAGIFRRPSTQEAFYTIFGNGKKAQEILDSMRKEADIIDSYRRVFGGSITGPISKDIQAFEEAANLVADFSTGDISGAFAATRNMLKYAGTARNAAAHNKIMFENDPKKLIEVAKGIRESLLNAKARDINARTRDRLLPLAAQNVFRNSRYGDYPYHEDKRNALSGHR